MSNELAPIHNAEVAISDDALAGLARQAQAMGDAHKLSTVMCSTGMVPKHFQGKPDDGAAAILYGAELGLNAIQSMQQIIVINGKPGVEARVMVALLKRKGYRVSTVESTDESVTVEGVSPTGDSEVSTWTIDRAKKAGFTKNPQYGTNPQAMLYAKAASEVCRRLAPDVLLGIAYSREELEMQQPVRATSERVDRPKRGTAGVMDALGISKPEPASKPEPEPELASREWLAALTKALDEAGIERDERKAFLSARVGRDLAAAAELTSAEVATVIDFLRNGEPA